MDITTIKSMTEKEYKKELKNSIQLNIKYVVNIARGHSAQMHDQQTSREMLERIVRDGKPYVSCFVDEEVMCQRIASAIFDAAKEISIWMTKGFNEFDNKEDYYSFSFGVKTEAGIAGRGFDKNLKEYVSNYVQIVLQRDYSEENMYGFYLKTAYPDIRPGHGAMATGRQFSEEKIWKDPNFLKDCEWEKMLFLAKKNYPQYRPIIVQNNGEKSLKLQYFVKQGVKIAKPTMVAYINETNIRIKEEKEGRFQKISFADCLFRDGGFGQAISDLEEKKHDIEHPKEAWKDKDDIAL